jgi:bifunctional UDP-N-acetylglucosamine pyrophosphorylase/glucosamine-1-phosphate N-acetyltransferase
MNRCAVIPAAGRGTRLGIDLPKLLVPVTPGQTIWSVLKDRIKRIVDHIHVVIAPSFAPLFARALENDPDAPMISTSIQPSPIGMGDAVFRGLECWSNAQTLLVVWSDQLHVSADTLKTSLELHAGVAKRVVIPLVSLAEPYVEYRFDGEGRLTSVIQSREGGECAPAGFGDVGSFVLSTGGLAGAWEGFQAKTLRGARTGEVNFLPFLVYLAELGWDVRSCAVDDPLEARGINTPADLEFFREMYRERSR